MADFLELTSEQLVSISANFDYLTATDKFLALKFFPFEGTDNLKLAIASLMEGNDVPVMALVHAFDTEARIGDRPDYQEINVELLLVKEKLNQGEALRKKIMDYGMSRDDASMLEAIYNDVNNLISRVLTRFEVMASELLCTGKVTVSENDVTATIDYGVPASHYFLYSGWEDSTHDIMADLNELQEAANGKIVRAVCNKATFGKILTNGYFKTLAASYQPARYVNRQFVIDEIANVTGISFTVYDEKYRLSARENTTYKFIPDDVIAFIATDTEIGRTFMTSTPEQDYAIANGGMGYVAVTQYKTTDPAGIWTKASAVGLPCPADPNVLYPCRLTAAPAPDDGEDEEEEETPPVGG